MSRCRRPSAGGAAQIPSPRNCSGKAHLCNIMLMEHAAASPSSPWYVTLSQISKYVAVGFVRGQELNISQHMSLKNKDITWKLHVVAQSTLTSGFFAISKICIFRLVSKVVFHTRQEAKKKQQNLSCRIQNLVFFAIWHEHFTFRRNLDDCSNLRIFT